jgi:hypothetical protein
MTSFEVQDITIPIMNIDIALITNALLRLEPSMQKEFAYMMLRLIRECSKL